MKDHWYCQVESEQFGPFTWDQMRAMASEGRLVPDSQVRREVDQRWFSAGKIPGLLAGAKAEPKDTAVATQPQAANGSGASGAKANGAPANGARGQASSNGHARDDSSQKLKIARPITASSPAGSPPMATASEPPAPPPVKKRASRHKPPLPEPAADASPLGIVVAPPVAAPKSTRSAAKSPLAAAAEKDENGLSPLLVGAMLGGVALLLVAVGVGVVAWQKWQGEDAKAALAAKAAAKPAEDKPAISEAELDAILGPIKPRDPAPPPAAKAVQDSPPAEPPAAIAAADTEPAVEPSPIAQALADPKVEAARKLIAAQPKWTPIEGVVIRGRDIQVEVAQIWLASDEKGTRIDPVLPSSAPAPTGPIAQALASATQRKYIFVDIRVSNSGAIPRKYTSWNTGGNITAVLADAKGEPLAMVPPEKTPTVERLQTLHIPAGQMIGDILVFEAPEQPFESLKLLLSQGAFATAGKSFALDVPVEFLFKRAEGLPPQTALAADDGPPAEGEAAVGKAAPKPVDPNAPPSLEDFTKQLEQDKKMLDKQNATDEGPKKPPAAEPGSKG